MKTYTTSPHQKVIKLAKRRPWGHKESHLAEQDTFGRFHNDAAKNARKNLTSEAFILWIAINSWADEGEFALSNKMMREEWSFADRTYRLCVQQLIDKKYLVPVKERSNIYIFYEDGFEDNSANFAVKSKNNDAAKIAGHKAKIADLSSNTLDANFADSTAKIADYSAKTAVEILHNTTNTTIAAAEPPDMANFAGTVLQMEDNKEVESSDTCAAIVDIYASQPRRPAVNFTATTFEWEE